MNKTPSAQRPSALVRNVKLFPFSRIFFIHVVLTYEYKKRLKGKIDETTTDFSHRDNDSRISRNFVIYG